MLLGAWLAGLLTGLDGTNALALNPDGMLDATRLQVPSNGDVGIKACSAFLFTDVWLIFELLFAVVAPVLLPLLPPLLLEEPEEVCDFFVSFETLQYGVFTEAFDAGVEGGGKLTAPDECLLSAGGNSIIN